VLTIFPVGRVSLSYDQATRTLLIRRLHPQQTSLKNCPRGQAQSLTNCPLVSDGARKSKVTVLTLRMTAPANPIAPSAAVRQKITNPVTLGNPQYLTTNLRIPIPIPSRFAQIPMDLQRYPSYYPPYFRRVTSPTICLFRLASRLHQVHSTH
jgi:hypothetical protein